MPSYFCNYTKEMKKELEGLIQEWKLNNNYELIQSFALYAIIMSSSYPSGEPLQFYIEVNDGKIDIVNRKKFDNLKTSTPDGQFVLYFVPPSINERIINQYSAFSFMNNPGAQIDHWLEKHETKYYRKIEIPSEQKLKIRDRLDMPNITEKVFFSGLDGLSIWLKRHYSDL